MLTMAMRACGNAAGPARARPGQVSMTVTFKDTTPPAEVPGEFYQIRKKLGDAAWVEAVRGVGFRLGAP